MNARAESLPARSKGRTTRAPRAVTQRAGDTTGFTGSELLRIPGVLNAEQCRRACALGDATQLDWGGMYAAPPDRRRALIGWIARSPDSAWLYQHLEALFDEVNRTLGLDLAGIRDGLQYTVYEPGMYIDWHVDSVRIGSLIRKLSLTIQLTDPAEYDGGGLEFHTEQGEVILSRPLGTALIFPSFVSHRVTRVTRGVRRSLVAWAHGPAFR
jgi:PKHD-type hydroxylase